MGGAINERATETPKRERVTAYAIVRVIAHAAVSHPPVRIRVTDTLVYEACICRERAARLILSVPNSLSVFYLPQYSTQASSRDGQQDTAVCGLTRRQSSTLLR